MGFIGIVIAVALGIALAPFILTAAVYVIHGIVVFGIPLLILGVIALVLSPAASGLSVPAYALIMVAVVCGGGYLWGRWNE
jgi:hypothetical protein